MIRKYIKAEYVTPTIYSLLVLFCIFFGFIIKSEGASWLLGALGLTLPWSVITFFFVMGAIHLGDNNGIVILILAPAMLNVYILYRVTKYLKSQLTESREKLTIIEKE